MVFCCLFTILDGIDKSPKFCIGINSADPVPVNEIQIVNVPFISSVIDEDSLLIAHRADSRDDERKNVGECTFYRIVNNDLVCVEFMV